VTNRDAAALAILSATAAFAAGCRRDGCVGGDDGTCEPPAACTALQYACGPLSGALSQKQLTESDLPLSSEPKTRATVGDFLLQNDLVRVVVSDPSHPSDLPPTCSAIIDLAPLATGSGDQINSI